MSYKKTYDDHKFLFDIGSASDMTGGYVDSEDLDEMLKTPTKKTAENCLLRQINYWFEVGTESGGKNGGMSALDLVDEFPRIREIAEEYGCDI